MVAIESRIQRPVILSSCLVGWAVQSRGGALSYRALVVPRPLLEHQRTWKIVGIQR